MTARRRGSRDDAAPRPGPNVKRPKLTVDLPAELLAELRAAAVSLPPREIGGSLAGLAERALRREVERLRKRWNDGEPFDAKGPVRRGRPPKP